MVKREVVIANMGILNYFYAAPDRPTGVDTFT